MTGTVKFIFLWVGLGVICFPELASAAFNEQIAIDARAISLANTCTADPPGLMSAHYNPAGLSLLKEGKTFSNGFVLPFIRRTGKFKADPDFSGLMGNTWGPHAVYNPEDPLSAHGGPDPLDGKEGTSSNGRMYIPFYGPVDLLFGASAGVGLKKRDSRWTVAFATYAPYGGGMAHRDADDPMRFGCKSVYLQHLIYAAPTVSYQATDSISLGVSIGMGQTAMGVEEDMRTPNELVAMTRSLGDATKDLEIPVVSEQTLPPPFLGGGIGPYEYNSRMSMDLRDDFTPSFNVGVLWRPKKWFSLGLAYQSAFTADLSGDYRIEYSEQFQTMVNWNSKTPMTMQGAGMLDLPMQGVPSQSGTVFAQQVFPHMFHSGVMIRPIDVLKLLFDVHWANWSALREDRFIFDQDIQLLKIAKISGYTGGNRTLIIERELKDTVYWGAGIEIQVLEPVTFRAGYEFRPASTRRELFDCLYFLPDMQFIGTGLGIQLVPDVYLDLSFGCLFNNSYKVSDNTSKNLNSTEFTNIVYNPYTGLDYEQKTEIFLYAFGVTMPFERQVELMRRTSGLIKGAGDSIKKGINALNPFGRSGDENY